MKPFGFRKYSQLVDEKHHPQEFKKGVKRIVTWAGQVGRDDLEYIHKKWGTIAVIGEYLLLKESGPPLVMTAAQFKKRFPNPSIIG